MISELFELVQNISYNNSKKYSLPLNEDQVWSL